MARRPSVRLEMKNADLATDFGLEWATKLFGEEAIASLPIRTVGKNKGKPKGFVIWRKALTSGWCQECQTPVAVGQLVDAWIGAGFCSNRSDAVSGQWLGRIQQLGCSIASGALFEEGRARYARERAQRQQDWEIEKAEMEAERSQSNG